MPRLAAVTSTRDAILDATDRIMARYGFRKMTMDDLAREAGLSKRTIYGYFEGKEDVGLSSITRVVDRIYEMLEEIAARQSSVADRLHAVLIERVMGRIGQVRDYHRSLDELFEAVRPAYMVRRAAYLERETCLVQRLLELGKQNGEFDVEDSEETARSLIQATNAFLPYSLSVSELGEPDQIFAQLKAMVDLLMRGLRPPGTIA